MSSIPQLVEAVRQDQDAGTELRQLFSSRYPDLLAWTLRLTRFDRAAAEELVHDAYVDLATSMSEIRTVANLDGYLYRALRNLNCTRVRREWRHEHDELDVLDYDSLHLRLHASRTADQVEFQNQIWQLCHLYCWRKTSSKSASILLLRFFRGFLPEEIMAIAGLSRASVDSQIRLARKEGKLFLEKPQEFRFTPPKAARFGSTCESGDLVRHLHALICAARQGGCLAPGEEGRETLTTAQLSHVVSCDTCLSSITRRLEIDPPSERWPLDGGGSEQELQLAKQTVREVGAHQPKSLLLAVNGEEFRSWKAAPSYSFSTSAEIRYLEIFSEQRLRLLYLDLEPGSPCGEQRAKRTVRLGEELALDISVEWYGTVSRILVEYAIPAPEPLIEAVPHQSPWRKLLDWLRWNPAPAAAGAACSLALLLVWLFGGRASTKPTAEVLLARAVQAEAANSGLPSHQVLAFEEIDGSGRVLQKGRVEVWHAKGETSKRFYDPAGQQISEQVVESMQSTDGCFAGTKVWSCDLSAREVEGRQGSLSLDEDAVHYRLAYRASGDAADEDRPMLVRAALVLNRHTLQVEEQQLWIESGGEIREYRYRELRYEAGHDASSPQQPKLRPQTLHMPHGKSEAASLPHRLLAAVEVLRTLGGDLDLELTLVRRGKDGLVIGGSLPSETEAVKARRVFVPLAAKGWVVLGIHSADEEQLQHVISQVTPVALRTYEVNAAKVPADDELRQAFRHLGTGEAQLDPALRLFTEAALEDVASAHREAWRLEQLTTLLTPAEVVSLSAEDRKLWLALLDDSLRALQSKLGRLDHRLGSLPFPSSTKNDSLPAAPPLESRSYLERIGEIVRRTRSLEQDLTGALAVRAGAQNESVPKLEDTYQQLKIAESLLSEMEARVGKYSQRE